MTTSVRVLIEGNKACKVSVAIPGQVDPSPVTVLPGTYTIRWLSGEQVLSVVEDGEFKT